METGFQEGLDCCSRTEVAFNDNLRFVGLRRIGLHPFDIPMLRNSVPYGGRPACMRCRWCVGFACEVNAKCGTQNTVVPTALASGIL